VTDRITSRVPELPDAFRKLTELDDERLDRVLAGIKRLGPDGGKGRKRS